MRIVIFLLMIVSAFLNGCNTEHYALKKSYNKLTPEKKVLADSILLYALDHEALYTLADTLKPMSSVKFYRWPVHRKNITGHDSLVKMIEAAQEITHALSKGDFQFVLNPYKYSDSIYRNMEIYVIRKKRLENMIRAHEDFYLSLGINAYSLPATTLAITEYGDKYDRWRSYGYLFGYPDHAVDFFVQAGKEQDSTLQFVKRNFFQIPVFAGDRGYFTYAIPENYIPADADSLIYEKALETLLIYNKIRNKIIDQKNKSAFKLWMKLLKVKNRKKSFV